MTEGFGATRKSFASTLNLSVQEGIRSVLGQVSLDVVLSKLQLSLLVESPDELHTGLTKLFGPAGKVLERLIVKDLFKRLKLTLEEPSAFDFVTHVNTARRVFSMNSIKQKNA